MTTKREIIDLAFNEIGVPSYNFDRPVEQTNIALKKLDAMMAQWSVKGIVFDPVYDPTGDVDTDVNEPAWVKEAIYLNLATRTAPEIGKSTLPATNAAARRAFLFVLGQYVRRYEMAKPGMALGAGAKEPNYPISTATEPVELPNGADVIEGNA